MNGNLVESLIGAVVLVVAAGFLYVAYTTTDIGTRGGYPLKARFEQVGGLPLGADVRIAGIKVGTVTNQTLDPQTYQAVINFTVQQGVKLSADTTASITADGLLGDTYLKLQPGGAWPGEEPEYLPPGAEIEFTEGAMDIFAIIKQAVFGSGDSGGDEDL